MGRSYGGNVELKPEDFPEAFKRALEPVDKVCLSCGIHWAEPQGDTCEDCGGKLRNLTVEEANA